MLQDHLPALGRAGDHRTDVFSGRYEAAGMTLRIANFQN